MYQPRDTTDHLVAATREIIIEQGVERCTLENICAQAGYSRGAFYSNFGTKDSLFAMVAEEEYLGLIAALRERVEAWRTASTTHPRMEDLLFEAIDAMGFNKGLYILHSELMMRSIRDPKWGARLLDINREFIATIGATLAAILAATGREPTVALPTLAHATIAVVTRAAGVEAMRIAAQTHIAGGVGPAPTTGVAASGARSIVEMVLPLLYGSSRPTDTTGG